MAAGVWAALLSETLLAQPYCPPQLEWQRSFGTGQSDYARRILQTADGGFVVAGESYGDAGEGTKSSPNYGVNDMWLVRLDAQGQKLWDSSYGGTRADYFGAMDHADDGGFILAGITVSIVGGNKTSPYYGNQDGWVVRVDASGRVLWNISLGGTGNDACHAIQRTADGGFIIGGTSDSPVSGNKSAPSRGRSDYWVARVDGSGTKLWDAAFGGSGDDFLRDLRQTPDGGFVLGGFSASEADGNKTAPRHGSYDYWLVRLDANGNYLWDRSYGGNDQDVLQRIVPAGNGDLLLAGHSRSTVSGTKTNQNFAYQNFWVLRVDGAGNEIWQRVYGGTRYDQLEDAVPISTNDFLLTGNSESLPGGTKTAGALGGSDYWIVRIDGDGNQIWDTSFGGTFSDEAYASTISDGAYLVAGRSSSVNGHNLGPHYGSSDIWMVKLRPDNALDCDNDGVPNAQDLCSDTAFAALVNSNGCSVEQFCPCDVELYHADYVACVERVSAEFENAGVITGEQRAGLVARAQSANCPPSVLLFGLVHVLIKDTVLSGAEHGHGFVPGTNPVYGASILLGEADAGVFVQLDAGEWGNYDRAWFMEGTVHGRIGGSNAHLATLRATKPDVEIYPVHIDFTALGATNLTFQYFTNGMLLNEEGTPGPVGTFNVRSAAHLHPRVNPLVRLPDGSVGALFEFDAEVYDGWLIYPYDRVFVRADNATPFDYISRVEVAAERTFSYFTFVDEQLGVFGNRHRVVGSGIFDAANRQLTIRRNTAPTADPQFGTLIEIRGAARVEVDLLPVALITYEAGFRLGISGQCAGSGGASFPCELASLHFAGDGATRLAFRPDFSGLSSAPALVIDVFNNGMPAGTCPADQSFNNYLELTNQPHPKIIGCGFTAYSNQPPSISFALDHAAVLVCPDGQRIAGTHFRIAPTNAVTMPGGLSAVSLTLSDPGPEPAFTIADERFVAAQPRLDIALSEGNVTLSWRDNTRLFRLESSDTLSGPFFAVRLAAEFVNNQNVVLLPRPVAGSSFFRLRAPD